MICKQDANKRVNSRPHEEINITKPYILGEKKRLHSHMHAMHVRTMHHVYEYDCMYCSIALLICIHLFTHYSRIPHQFSNARSDCRRAGSVQGTLSPFVCLFVCFTNATSQRFTNVMMHGNICNIHQQNAIIEMAAMAAAAGVFLVFFLDY